MVQTKCLYKSGIPPAKLLAKGIPFKNVLRSLIKYNLFILLSNVIILKIKQVEYKVSELEEFLNNT